MSNNSVIEMLVYATIAGLQLPHEESYEQLDFFNTLSSEEVDDVCNKYSDELPFQVVL